MVGPRAGGACGGEGQAAANERKGAGLSCEEEQEDEERRLLYTGLPTPSRQQLFLLRELVQKSVLGKDRPLITVSVWCDL